MLRFIQYEEGLLDKIVHVHRASSFLVGLDFLQDFF